MIWNKMECINGCMVKSNLVISLVPYPIRILKEFTEISDRQYIWLRSSDWLKRLGFIKTELKKKNRTKNRLRPRSNSCKYGRVNVEFQLALSNKHLIQLVKGKRNNSFIKHLNIGNTIFILPHFVGCHLWNLSLV